MMNCSYHIETFYVTTFIVFVKNNKIVNSKDAARWGLNTAAIMDLGQRLYGFWERFSGCLRTHRHDTSAYGLIYLKGLLTLAVRRNYKEIARRIESPDSDG